MQPRTWKCCELERCSSEWGIAFQRNDGVPHRQALLVTSLPERTGSDLREIVRRTVLSSGHDGHLSTAALLAGVGSGRYRATAPAGMYL